MYQSDIEKALVGKAISSVAFAGGQITFRLTNGNVVNLEAEGDCCSHSWIEDCVIPDNLLNAVINAVEDSGGIVEEENTQDYDCLKVYQTHIQTSKGTISIEYRNSSNGYYGGYLVLA